METTISEGADQHRTPGSAWRIRADRSFDGWAYTVAIEPWSERAAAKVRRL
jgi:hypothetical protein